MKSIFSVSRKALMALTAVVALLFAGPAAFAQGTSKGKVLDSKGEPIIGASVYVPGTTNGVITDIDGNFELRVAPGTTLEVSCIGYVTKQVSAAPSMTVRQGTILDHSMKIDADLVTVTDEQLIPTGENIPVEGPPFDFREAKTIVRDLDESNTMIGYGKGYDHNFCLNGDGFRKVVELTGDRTGISMEVWTDQPAVQVYCGGAYPDEKGKEGKDYGRFAGIALETQNYPDAVNHPEFPNSILRPGEEYRTRTEYRFF